MLELVKRVELVSVDDASMVCMVASQENVCRVFFRVVVWRDSFDGHGEIHITLSINFIKYLSHQHNPPPIPPCLQQTGLDLTRNVASKVERTREGSRGASRCLLGSID